MRRGGELLEKQQKGQAGRPKIGRPGHTNSRKAFAKAAGLFQARSEALVSRPDRKETARMLAAKGFSTRQIAEITGWSFKTIARDLVRVSDDTKSVSNDTAKLPSSTGSVATKQHRAEVGARERGWP